MAKTGFTHSAKSLGIMFGVSSQEISKAVRENRLTEGVSYVTTSAANNSRKFNPNATALEWYENGGPKAKNLLSHPRHIVLAEASRLRMADQGDNDGGGEPDELQIRQARILQYTLSDLEKLNSLALLEKKEIELQKIRGTLVEKALVEKILFEFGQRVRQRIEAIPNRVVDDLMAVATRPEALKLLDDAIGEALMELSGADALDYENKPPIND